MLSYRHSFHAGNHADVLKHTVQTLIIEALKTKDKPLFYLDTHAGAGRYQLAGGRQAEQTGEYLQGIARIWQQKSTPAELQPYLNMVAQFNPKGQLRYYPGSPAIAQHLLRPQDRLRLTELHPTDYPLLRKLFGRDQRAQALREDGYHQLKSQLPPISRRGLILIDPPYELKTDYQTAISALQEGYRRFSTGTYALWYPVVFRPSINRMLRDLQASGIRNILQIELAVQKDSDLHGMTASGMLVINPPWKLEEQMQRLLPWLYRKLVPDNTGQHFVRWLVPE